MSLAHAIEQLEAEVAAFKQGTSEQPKEGTTDWFVLRAKSLGLSFLKRTQQAAVEDSPQAAETLYRRCSRAIKGPLND